MFVVVKGRFDSRNHDDRNFSVSEKGTYGTAAYLSEKKAKKLLTADNEHSLLAVSKIFGSENGIILGTFPNGHIVTKRAIAKENMNMFVCGAPGSGKSYMFVRPFIAQCVRREESFVCTDPSGELLETMGGYAKACGYKVKVFNLVDPEKSDSWNVTGEVGINQMHAQIAVSTIIKNTLEGERPDPFWDNGEKNLLKALLLYINSDAYTGNKSLGELYKLLASDRFASETLECLKNLPENHPAKLSYNIYAQATESVQQSFASGLATRLQIFQSEAIRNMTAFDDIIGLDNNTQTVVASRLKANERNRQTFYFDKDDNGYYKIYEGSIVEARIIGIGESSIRAEVFGAECTIHSKELSWDWITDVSESFSVGERVMVRITEIQGRDQSGEFSIAASVRQAQSNKQAELLKTVTKGNLYTGQIVDIRKGTYLIKLSNGVNALAHSSHCKKPVMRSDVVAFVVNFVDNKTMMATGNIIRIIKPARRY